MIGYERYGQQVDLEVIKDMMMRENNDFPIEELNTPRKGRHAKSDRISRLEPDIREGRFYLPCVAYHGDFGKAGEHICYWSVWTQKHNENAAAIEEKHAHSVGQVTYRPMKGLTKARERCVLTAQKHRIVTALRRGSTDNLNQTGQLVVRRSLNIQPTVTIRPGFPVRVIVNRDLVLAPYQI